MSTCVTTPTATSTSLSTSESVSTSFTETVSTPPGEVEELTSIYCVLTSDSTCAESTTDVQTITIDGTPVTNTVPVLTTTFFSVHTEYETLYGTSCRPTDTGTEEEEDPDEEQNSGSSAVPNGNDIVTDQSTTTPPASVYTSESLTTLPGGSVSIGYFTVTTTPPPSVVNVPSTQSPDQSRDGADSNLGPIIGGAVGGFIGLICLVLLVWFIIRRRKRWDDVFDKEDERIIPNAGRSRRFSLGEDVDVEPKPYEYGLVGHSPPISPPQSASNDHSAGYSSAYATNALSRNEGTSNPAPLNLSPAVSPSVHSHSRPSTAGSTQPLVSRRRPGSSQSFSSSQMHHRMTPSPGALPDEQGYFNRAGSPVSIQPELGRRLQVANAPPTPSRSSVAMSENGQSSSNGAGSGSGSNRLTVRNTLTTGLTGGSEKGGGLNVEGEASGSGTNDAPPPAYSER